MVEKDSIIRRKIERSDANAEILLEETLLELLRTDFTKTIDIVENFIRYYLGKNNLDFVNVNFEVCKNGFEILEKGNNYVFGSETITIRTLPFDKKEFQANLVELFKKICHELEHYKTEVYNTNLGILNVGEMKKYISSNMKEGIFGLGNNISYSMYFMSENELNSRNAEVECAKILFETFKKLIKQNEGLKTKTNLKILKCFEACYNTALKTQQKAIKEHSKVLKTNQKFLKQKAIEAFNFIKEKDALNWDNVSEVDKNSAILFLVNYIKTYKDKDLLKELFDYGFKTPHSYIVRFSNEFILASSENFKREYYDKLLIFDDDYKIKEFQYITDENFVAEHLLMFYGDNCDIGEENPNFEAYIKLKEKYKMFNFMGIPYEEKENGRAVSIINGVEDSTYSVTINGEKMVFNSKREMMLEVSKYINSAWLDDLTEENIAKINEVFGVEVISIKTNEENEVESETDIYSLLETNEETRKC